MATQALMTADQFEQMQTAETEDYELVEGELIPLPSATPWHAEIRDGLGDLVRSYFRSNRIGIVFAEVDCRIAEDEVRRPDLSVFLGANATRLDRRRIPVPFPPDIAVEILSPSETAIGLRHKVRDYLQAGSIEVWLLDHSNGEVQVCTSAGVRVLELSAVLESPLLPGFRASVAELLTPAN